MSWDKYNEARRKAKEASQKLIKVADGDKSVKLSSSEKSDAKSAVKNARKYKWLFSIFIVLAILACVTLPFGDTLQPMLDNLLKNNNEVDASLTNAVTLVENSDLQIHYVDVGQGDCILVNLPDGKNMVIDSGSETDSSATSQKVIDYIGSTLLDDGEIIDYMILTHPDSDHLYFLPDILDNFEVATIIRPYTFYVSDGKDSGDITVEQKEEVAAKELNTLNQLNSQYGYNIQLSSKNSRLTVAMYDFISRIYTETYGANDTPATIDFPVAGKQIKGADYTLTFYSPVDPNETYSSWNDYSCVMVLDYQGTKMAFTGDAETKVEREILDNQDNLPLPDVNIMDMGHHGSKTSSSEAFVEALNPEYAIISCGEGNKYGHPNQETLDTLDKIGVGVNERFITAESGNIIIGLGYIDPNSDASETNFGIAYTGDKTFADTRPVKMEWWNVVVTFIILEGLILLVIIPQIIKATQKTTKQLKKVTKK